MTGNGAFLPGVNTTQKRKGPFYQGRGRPQLCARLILKFQTCRKKHWSARELMRKIIHLGPYGEGVVFSFLHLFWKTVGGKLRNENVHVWKMRTLYS